MCFTAHHVHISFFPTKKPFQSIKLRWNFLIKSSGTHEKKWTQFISISIKLTNFCLLSSSSKVPYLVSIESSNGPMFWCNCCVCLWSHTPTLFFHCEIQREPLNMCVLILARWPCLSFNLANSCRERERASDVRLPILVMNWIFGANNLLTDQITRALSGNDLNKMNYFWNSLAILTLST